jgi:hypothetical protein
LGCEVVLRNATTFIRMPRGWQLVWERST